MPAFRASVVLIVLVAAVLGAGTGYYAARQESGRQALEYRDIARTLRTLDLDNRLSALRAMRRGQLSAEEIALWERSAIALLQLIEVNDVTAASASVPVLRQLADTLAAYMRDFPESQFSDPQYKAAVSRITAFRERG